MTHNDGCADVLPTGPVTPLLHMGGVTIYHENYCAKTVPIIEPDRLLLSHLPHYFEKDSEKP